MASGPMLPLYFWIQEQDAVIRIIPTSGECCDSGGMQAHFGGTQNSVFCAGAGLFLVLESRLPGRS